MEECERLAIDKEFGPDYYEWDTVEKEYRTAIKNGQCVFLADNKCSIHGRSFYPEICGHYPHENGDGDGPYPYEISCPEWNDNQTRMECCPKSVTV